MTLHRKYKFI